MYKITLIAAISNNFVIGKNNELLWHLPKDFLWFKEKTKGFDVVMGRKTMENIMTFTKGNPLPFRNNIVLSQQLKEQDGFTILKNYQDILNLSQEKEIMIIGGEQIYKLFLPFANKLILTQINHEFSGDAFFPQFDKGKYTITFQQNETENNLNYDFVIYEKIDN